MSEIMNGSFNGSRVPNNRTNCVAGVKHLSTLPGLPELRSQLLAMFNTPATQLVRLFGTPGTQLARVIDAHAESQGGGESDAGSDEAAS